MTVTPSPTPAPPLVCEPDYVPGWLDENGMPTGCVYNGPGHDLEVVEVGVFATQETLATTGVDPWAASILALALIVAGLQLRLRRP